MTSDHSRSDTVLEAINQESFPRLVYKFREEGEFTDKIFTSLSLWFAAPKTFNDPFDCNLSEIKNHSLADAQKFYVHLSAGRPQHVLQGLPPASVSDLEKILEAAKKKALDSTGVLCVSKKCDNILMWSHYAKDHKGLAIEFDMTEDPDAFTTPINVDYMQSYTPTNYFANPHSTVTQIIKTKSIFWAYEEEIRIMKAGFTGAVSFKPGALKRVFFGCGAEDKFIAHIMGLCSKRHLQHVQFFKMCMAYGQFALQPHPIESQLCK